MKKLLIFNEKISRFIFCEFGCGTTCYSNLQFLKSLCEELSESMVGSFGIHFFTRLDSGEQCTVSPRPHSVQDCHKKPYYLNEDTLFESTNLYRKRSKKIQNTD